MIRCASTPFHSIFYVVLPHLERTMTEYVDVVASAHPTILEVFNRDVTIIVYFNASAV